MPRKLMILLILAVSGHSCVYTDNLRGYEDDEAYYIPGKEIFWNPNLAKDSVHKGEDFYHRPQNSNTRRTITFFQNYYYTSPYGYPDYFYSSPVQNPHTPFTQEEENVTHYPRPSIGSNNSGPVNIGTPSNSTRIPRKESKPQKTTPKK